MIPRGEIFMASVQHPLYEPVVLELADVACLSLELLFLKGGFSLVSSEVQGGCLSSIGVQLGCLGPSEPHLFTTPEVSDCSIIQVCRKVQVQGR